MFVALYGCDYTIGREGKDLNSKAVEFTEDFVILTDPSSAMMI
jgi:hypothetical protein